MHGTARLRLVGTPPLDGMEECPNDDFPKPLPFPSCVRDLPRRASGHSKAGQDALAALERMNFSFNALRAALEDDGADGPRAA